MITFRANRVERMDNTPIISDREIDDFAREVILDYKPKLLDEPCKINWEHFLESYCEATLKFEDIFNEDPNKPILGATAFNHEEIKVFNREKKCVSPLKVDPVTVIIDNSVVNSEYEGMSLFTGLHEGGHILIHSAVYKRDENLLSFFDGENSRRSVVCCRKENIESFGEPVPRNYSRTSAEWREHHADYFAAAIAMPLDTFVPFVEYALLDMEIKFKKIVLGRDEDLDYLAEHHIPELIREAYGVSKKAARIKLKKCGFVIGRQLYNQETEQMMLTG